VSNYTSNALKSYFGSKIDGAQKREVISTC
jgi:hypothetical protein